MRLIYVDSDYLERDFIRPEFVKAFPSTEIIEFTNAGDFLLWIEGLQVTDVIVMDYVLSLQKNGISDEQVWTDFDKLNSLFPEVVKGWNYLEAGGRILSHMKKIGLSSKIIVYTEVDKRYLPENLFLDPKIGYLRKDSESQDLIFRIKKLISVPA